MKPFRGRPGYLVLLIAPAVIAASLTTTTQAPTVVVAGGGGTSTTANHGATVTIGQGVAGRAGTSTSGARIGFWETTGGFVDPTVAVGDLPGFRNQLMSCMPNPFNPATTIRFSLREQSDVRLDLYDLRGQRVARLLDEPRGPGDHTVAFRPTQLASGVYLLEMRAGAFRDIQRMVLLK